MDKFCKFCGTQHTSASSPQTCTSCGGITWHNPKPVAVVCQPIYDAVRNRNGILIGQRAISPGKGEWGLVGGFIDDTGETAEEAVVREMFEETGFHISKSTLFPMHTYASGDGILLVFFENKKALPLSVLDNFEPNSECSAVRVAWEAETLCFQSHTEAMKQWFWVEWHTRGS